MLAYREHQRDERLTVVHHPITTDITGAAAVVTLVNGRLTKGI